MLPVLNPGLAPLQSRTATRLRCVVAVGSPTLCSLLGQAPRPGALHIPADSSPSWGWPVHRSAFYSVQLLPRATPRLSLDSDECPGPVPQLPATGCGAVLHGGLARADPGLFP